MPGKLKLERCDVPAGHAFADDAAPERSACVCADRVPRRPVEHTGRGKRGLPLQSPNPRARLRPREAVDRAAVESARPQRHLKRSRIRISDRRSLPGKRESREGRSNEGNVQPQVHSRCIGETSTTV